MEPLSAEIFVPNSARWTGRTPWTRMLPLGAGFAAIYMPQSTSVSEGSTLTAVPWQLMGGRRWYGLGIFKS